MSSATRRAPDAALPAGTTASRAPPPPLSSAAALASATLAQLSRRLQNGAMLPENISALTADRRFRADVLASSAPPPPASEALNWTASLLSAVLPGSSPLPPSLCTTLRHGSARRLPSLHCRRVSGLARLLRLGCWLLWAASKAGASTIGGSGRGGGIPRRPALADCERILSIPVLQAASARWGLEQPGTAGAVVPPASQLPSLHGCAAWGRPAQPRRAATCNCNSTVLQPTTQPLPCNSLPQEYCNCGKQCACCPSPAGERCEACRWVDIDGAAAEAEPMGRGLLAQGVELAWHHCISPLAPHGGPYAHANPALAGPLCSAQPHPTPLPLPRPALPRSRFNEKESCT